MSRDNARVEVGKGSFPFVAVGVAVVVIAAVVLAAAYASRTPYGSVVKSSPEIEGEFNDYVAKNEKRFAAQKTFYNCRHFMGSLFSDVQDLAIAVEQGAWRPDFQPDGAAGNLLVIKAHKEGDGKWTFTSVPVEGGVFDPSAIAADDPKNPCNIAYGQP